MLIDFRKLFPKYNIKPTGVLHVGANVGEEAEVYQELGIEYVVWLEADPDTYKKLKENLKSYKGQFGFNVLAGDEDYTDVIFHLANNNSQSSSVLEPGTHKVKHPEVKFKKDITLKMRKLYNLFLGTDLLTGCDFLNIDVQGAELKVLRGMDDLVKQFKWAYLEVNKEELYKGCALVEDVDLYLLSHGFRRVETFWVGNTGWGDALYIR